MYQRFLILLENLIYLNVKASSMHNLSIKDEKCRQSTKKNTTIMDIIKRLLVVHVNMIQSHLIICHLINQLLHPNNFLCRALTINQTMLTRTHIYIQQTKKCGLSIIGPSIGKINSLAHIQTRLREGLPIKIEPFMIYRHPKRYALTSHIPPSWPHILIYAQQPSAAFANSIR